MDSFFFQRLPEDLQGTGFEFRELVKKENTVVRQGHFSRDRDPAAAGEGLWCNGVVGTAEGAAADKRLLRVEKP